MSSPFVSIEEALADIEAGRLLILVDDEDRENEGDLVLAAEKVTAEKINFMIKHGRGLVCLPMQGSDLDRLQIPLQAEHNSKYRTAFTLSIEAAQGVTTGISATDRMTTILTAIDANSCHDDIATPGHIFPIRAKEGGVLARAGHTEGSVDLARLAGLKAAAVICEIIKDDGEMARLPDLIEFAAQHQLKIASINDLIAYRMRQESLVHMVAQANLPLAPYGNFKIKVFENKLDKSQHVALISGDIDPNNPCLVRVHSECLTGDIFGSNRCDCGQQLQAALEKIGQQGGVLVYLRGQEGRGIGLANKIKAYALQEQGYDTVEANHQLGFSADHRDYGIGSQILHLLGVKKMRVLTNNPRKLYGLQGYGLELVAREPLEIIPTAANQHYLATKRDKLGHLLNLDLLATDESTLKIVEQ